MSKSKSIGRTLSSLGRAIGAVVVLALALGAQTASAATSIQVVDSAGNVGYCTSLALDASGNPVISYWDYSNSDLKLAHCDDPACAGVETPATVDSAGDVGWDTSLALDASGNPVISYSDTSNGDLKLAHCDDPACAGVETPVTVDSAGVVGWGTSLALDASGNPVISYWDVTNRDLKLAHCDDPACDPTLPSGDGAETLQTVDGAGQVGQYTSLALDGDGFPVISYFDFTNGDLKLAHCNDPACDPTLPSGDGAETLQTVDGAGQVGQYTSLALDGDGFPVISYFDSTNFDLKLAHCDDPACAGGAETLQTVDGAGNVGAHTSLALDGDGFPVISYLDITNFDLKLAHCDNVDCAPPLPCPLANCSFESPIGANRFPGKWRRSGLTLPGDGTDRTTFTDGAQSFRFRGNGTLKKLYQDVAISGPSGDQFNLTFSWRGNKVTGKTGLFRVMAVLYYTDGTSKKFYVNMPIGSNGWTDYSLPFTATKPYNRLRVEIDFGKKGVARFDDFGLTIN